MLFHNCLYQRGHLYLTVQRLLHFNCGAAAQLGHPRGGSMLGAWSVSTLLVDGYRDRSGGTVRPVADGERDAIGARGTEAMLGGWTCRGGAIVEIPGNGQVFVVCAEIS